MKVKLFFVVFEVPIMLNQSSPIYSKLVDLLKKLNTLLETFFNVRIVLSSSSLSLYRLVLPFLCSLVIGDLNFCLGSRNPKF